MFGNDTAMTIFFRILNFLLFFGLGYYLFYRYLLDGIRKNILNRKKALQELENTYQVLREGQEKIAQEIAAQHNESEYLVSKIKTWALHVKNEEEALFDRIKMYQEQQKKRHIKQQEYQGFRKIAHGVTKKALAETHKKLQEDFQNYECNTLFINEIITQLQKNYL